MGSVERRRVQYPDGRRISERRAVSIPVASPELPRKAARHAGLLTFMERLEAPPEFQEDIDLVRTVVRFQGGDQEAFAEIYGRWFDRVYAYLRLTLLSSDSLDQQVCSVFSDAARLLTETSPSPAQIRPLMFGLAYRAGRADSLDALLPLPVDASHMSADPELADMEEDGLDWLTDEELLLLIERRPSTERHALALRYLGGLTFAEIAAIMGMQTKPLVELHRVAVRAIESTLASVTRSPRVGGRMPMARLGHQTPVLYRRQRALRAA